MGWRSIGGAGGVVIAIVRACGTATGAAGAGRSGAAAAFRAGRAGGAGTRGVTATGTSIGRPALLPCCADGQVPKPKAPGVTATATTTAATRSSVRGMLAMKALAIRMTRSLSAALALGLILDG